MLRQRRLYTKPGFNLCFLIHDNVSPYDLGDLIPVGKYRQSFKMEEIGLLMAEEFELDPEGAADKYESFWLSDDRFKVCCVPKIIMDILPPFELAIDIVETQ